MDHSACICAYNVCRQRFLHNFGICEIAEIQGKYIRAVINTDLCMELIFPLSEAAAGACKNIDAARSAMLANENNQIKNLESQLSQIMQIPNPIYKAQALKLYNVSVESTKEKIEFEHGELSLESEAIEMLIQVTITSLTALFESETGHSAQHALLILLTFLIKRIPVFGPIIGGVESINKLFKEEDGALQNVNDLYRNLNGYIESTTGWHLSERLVISLLRDWGAENKKEEYDLNKIVQEMHDKFLRKFDDWSGPNP